MGLFSNLLGRRKPDLPPVDLGLLECDVHSHFIPGIDDGAPTVEASMELLRAMHDLGFRKVVTTPHSMADGYRNPPEVILGGLEKLRRAVKGSGIPLEVEAAAEYYLDHALMENVASQKLLTFGRDMVLFELPFLSEPAVLFNLVFEMQTQGFRPVLAHPERYTFWFADLAPLEKLKDRGVLFQLNTIALGGAYGPAVKKAAERIIDKGWYELAGSDCHGMKHIEALQAVRTEPYLHKLMDSGKLINAGL
ncbi:MAG: histidinol phosphatase [Flavobacteriales bacterium]|nr:histidinol phosphatase [Flavobacteriales bacterium]MBP9079446.1 histidinol phosphatase [Flavobacteriales bacterium]